MHHWGNQTEQQIIPSDDELAALQAQSLAEAQTTASELEDHFNQNQSPDTRYRLVRGYIDQRRRQAVEEVINNAQMPAATTSFNTLATLVGQTDSLYTKRLITYAMNCEAHNIADFAYETDDLPAGSWHTDENFTQEAADKVEWRLSANTQQDLADHPEYHGLVQYGLSLKRQSQQLGDPDYYAPSPFEHIGRDLVDNYSLESGTLELALETSHLFGVPFDSLSHDAQLQLFAYGVSLDQERYDRVGKVFANLPHLPNRIAMAEAFLALEFGDDFAPLLLDLAESSEPDALVSVVEALNDIRYQSQRFAKAAYYSEHPLDQQIAAIIPQAIAKRTTEQLALASQDGIEAVARTIDTIRTVVAENAAAFADDTFQVVEADAQYTTFRAQEHKATLTARPAGDNARIGHTVRGLGADGRQRLNIRLDYEAGKLSLDIGSAARVGVNSSDIGRHVGQGLAEGELAMASRRAKANIGNSAVKQVITLHGNHVREPFEHLPDISSEEFTALVERFVGRLKLADSTAPQR